MYIIGLTFTVKQDLMVYGRRHTLVDCDEFTRNFLTAQGVDVNPSQPVPTDQFQEHRDKIEVG